LIRYLIFLLSVLPTLSLAGESDSTDYFQYNYLRYEDFIYAGNLHTVQLYKKGDDLSSPLLDLSKEDDRLVLGFDDFDADVKDYRFTVIHCDASWKPSDLLVSQYISGFPEDRITDYRFSVNTIQKYTHYSISFPTGDMKPLLSGNYLLRVYLASDPERTLITRIFRIVDPRVEIDAYIHKPSVVTERDTRQEVDFRIFHSGYAIDDVYRALKVVITKNDRLDNAISNLKPLFVKPGELIYDYNKENVFDGGNEFRYFDIRTLKYQTERVSSMDYDSVIRVTLFADEDRSAGRYSIQPDINGKFTVKIRDGSNSDIESDYAYVTFSLPYRFPLTDGNLYVFGKLSDWKFNEQCRLRYFPEDQVYKTQVYLKQGYYNYEYVFLKDGTNKADETFIEGNHFETDNEYTIYVYNRPIGSRYDHLVGVRKFNSKSFY
jgi:hypothetical protein